MHKKPAPAIKNKKHIDKGVSRALRYCCMTKWGEATMPDCKSKKDWDKNNVLFVTTKLFANTDSDIIEFLDGKPRATTIKLALREYMANHQGEDQG